MNSNDLFRSKINAPSKYSLYFKLKQKKASSNKDFFCLVEGKTDEIFYNNVNHPFFKRNRIEFLYMPSAKQKPDYLVGKEAVIEACSMVFKENKELLKRCIFIVDHDDFGISYYCNVYPEKCFEYITVLPVYSFENYFFQQYNLNQVLMPLFQEQKEEFLESYNKFLDSIVEYFALKRVITASCQLNELSRLDYKKDYSDDIIFSFDFSSGEPFDKIKLKHEIGKMAKLVKKSKEHRDFYKKSVEILSNNREYIKGKVLFNFFANYLKYVNELDLTDCYKCGYIHFIKKVKIDLKVIYSGEPTLNSSHNNRSNIIT